MPVKCAKGGLSYGHFIDMAMPAATIGVSIPNVNYSTHLLYKIWVHE